MPNRPATLIGLAIGDALGAPFEFKNTNIIRRAGWDGKFKETHRWGGLSKGQWTDDTKMAIHLSMALIGDSGELKPESIAQQYMNWYNSGDLRGIGGQTNLAISKMIQGETLMKCGRIDSRGFASNKFCGNGTVMRCAPIGVWFRDNEEIMIRAAIADAKLTHDHIDAKHASVAMCIALAWNEEEPDVLINVIADVVGAGNVTNKLRDAQKMLKRGDTWEEAVHLGSSGRADETFASSMFCYLKNRDNFQDAVVQAVKMGGDTDTRAAITGALSGNYLGADNIPKHYLDEVEDSDVLLKTDMLLQMGPEELNRMSE
jgi:ADP-ribosylglycohydrolase